MYQLCYVSSATDKLNGEPGIKAILEEAHQFNSKNNITGVLMFRGGIFLQLLEGDEELVLPLYKKIEKDLRHSNLICLFKINSNEARIFGDWSMAYKSLDDLDIKFVNEILSWNKLISASKEVDNHLILHLLSRFKSRIGK